MSHDEHSSSDRDLYCGPSCSQCELAARNVVFKPETAVTLSLVSPTEEFPPPKAPFDPVRHKIEKEHLRRCRRDRGRLEAEVRWRESEFQRLAKASDAGHVQYPQPLLFGIVAQLADHPDLLLRYFQNERRINWATEWGETFLEDDGMFGPNNPYTMANKLREERIVVHRVSHWPVVKALLHHVANLLIDLQNGGYDLPDDELLTEYDQYLYDFVIDTHPKLRQLHDNNVTLEKRIAGYRWFPWAKLTGIPKFDEWTR